MHPYSCPSQRGLTPARGIHDALVESRASRFSSATKPGEFGVLVQGLDVGAVPVPPLDLGELLGVGDLEGGQDEAVTEDVIESTVQGSARWSLGMVRRLRARSVEIFSAAIRQLGPADDLPEVVRGLIDIEDAQRVWTFPCTVEATT